MDKGGGRGGAIIAREESSISTWVEKQAITPAAWRMAAKQWLVKKTD